jgi:hypothetical protein
LAAGTVNLNPAGRQFLTHANWEDILPLAEHAGALAERAIEILFFHEGETAGREDESGVDEAVEVHGALVEFEEALIVEVVRLGTLLRENHLHGLAAVLHFFAQAIQVEVVADVVVIHLHEELVPLEVAKPRDPSAVCV